MALQTVEENGVWRVAGLPVRWGQRAYKNLGLGLSRGGALSVEYVVMEAHIEAVLAGAVFALDSTDAQLCMLAEQYAVECANHALSLSAVRPGSAAPGSAIRMPKNQTAEIRAAVAGVVESHGIAAPDQRDDAQAIARAGDPAWWRRAIRRQHGRELEAAAVRLGYVSSHEGVYVSDETARRRISQTARNVAMLESAKIRNEDGEIMTLAQAAATGMGNKKNRRHELMLRLAGCEDISIERADQGVFITLTCPSKYHAVLAKTGKPNPKYAAFGRPDPRQAQEYLNGVWQMIRAAYGRLGIMPYGFRIAEPHHDGCPHWHILVFVKPSQVEAFCEVVTEYAIAEDADELAKTEHRVKFEMIDRERGSAAAYIAKYISKNIDVDDAPAHDDVDGDALVMPQGREIKMSQRVDAWAGVWGIRQFQPVGQPPVTVWREIRRVSKWAIKGAATEVKMAWDAAQRIEGEEDLAGTKELIHAASFGDYIRAQGGVCLGRDYLIGIAVEPVVIQGRYGVFDAFAPVGIFARSAPAVVHGSTRYVWTRLGRDAAVGSVLDSPWSPVNNCTDPAEFWPCRDTWFKSQGGELVAQFDDAWFLSDEYQKFFVPAEVVAGEMIAAEFAAAETRKNTVWTRLSSDKTEHENARK